MPFTNTTNGPGRSGQLFYPSFPGRSVEFKRASLRPFQYLSKHGASRKLPEDKHRPATGELRTKHWSLIMKTMQASLIVVSATLAFATLQPLNSLAQGEPTVGTTAAAAKTDAQLLKIASPLEEVAELSKSGVGDAVIINYIQSSDRTYNVGAKDIINLRNQGVSTEVTTALIQRGAEQRQAVADAAKQQAQAAALKPAQTETVAVAPTYQTQPATTVVATPATVTYYEPVQPASTVSVTYIGYPRYSYYAAPCYPRYVTYGSYYSPSYCYPRPSFAVGVGFGGGYRGGYYGGSYRSSARYCR